MANKRRDARYSVFSAPLKCLRGDSENSKITISDISCGGLGMTTNERISRGDKLQLEIIIPGDDIPMFVEAEVTWSAKDPDMEKTYNAGLRLTNVDICDKKRLLQYIDKSFVRLR